MLLFSSQELFPIEGRVDLHKFVLLSPLSLEN